MKIRALAVLILAVLLMHAIPARAQAGPIVVNDGDRITLPSNVPAQVQQATDEGLAASDLAMERIIMVLAPRPGIAKQREQFLHDLYDPNSPLYHQWLTPDEYGARFGINDGQLNAITNWLQSYGFTIDEVGRGRGWINFSGTVAQVEGAFRVQMRQYRLDGNVHHANSGPISIPRGLSGIVLGLVSLHDFHKPPMHIPGQAVDPNYTSGSSHYLAPADFATIYNVNPVYTAGYDGTGQTIAIVGRTDIQLSDVQTFRSYFGLPAKDPIFTHNGTDPGNLGGGEETEADLDVQWSGAVAKNATINFVISASTVNTDGVDLSAQYIVNNNLAPVMSTSFGLCEQSLGASENSFYNNLWSQAAAQGITSFVSSGDNGAAGCDSASASTGTMRAVNGLASTPYNVAVGGTQFMDTTNPSLYWASSNNATTKASALSYIPEQAWNESGSVPGGSGLWSTSGGASTLYPKPSWQVPGAGDGMRDLPDVSLSAASHDGYLIFQGGGLYSVGGTSAASPSFAGLMALINQKTGTHQGNANTIFYPLANNQYDSCAPVVFHDITVGNNTVPGVTGFNAVPGYDQATGLGSVDANALVNAWVATPTFYLCAVPTSVSVAQGGTGTSTLTTSISGGFNAGITFSASGLPSGVTAGFNPNPIPAPGGGTSTVTFTAAANAAVGTTAVTITATGGGVTRTATINLTVTQPDFTIGANPTSVSVAQGSSGTSTITTTVSGGFNNAITLSASGQPAGVTPSFSPNPIAAPGAGSSTLTFTVAANAAVGTYPITVTGTGGAVTHTTTVNLTVTSGQQQGFAIGFDLRATQGYVSDPAGNTYVLGAGTIYPTTRSGATFGWQSTTNVARADRSTGVDPRLAGVNYVANNVAPITFQVDLPGPGTYNLSVAIGDATAGRCFAGCRVEFHDGATLLFVLTPPSMPSGSFADANGNVWTAAQWPASATSRQVTMSGSTLTVVLGANNGSSSFTPLAFLGISQ